MSNEMSKIFVELFNYFKSARNFYYSDCEIILSNVLITLDNLFLIIGIEKYNFYKVLKDGGLTIKKTFMKLFLSSFL